MGLRGDIVVARFGDGLSTLTAGNVGAWFTVNFSADGVRARVEEESDSIGSGSSQNSGCPITIDNGSGFSDGVVGADDALDRPDTFRRISRLFLLTGPGVPDSSGGNPDICRATLNKMRSFLDKGVPGA